MTRTYTRRSGITITAICPHTGVDIVLSRPSSIHGAAVAIKRYKTAWASGGWTGVTVRIKGVPLTEEEKLLVDPEWRQFLV